MGNFKINFIIDCKSLSHTFLFLFWDSVFSSGWSRTPCLAEDDHELLTLLSLPPGTRTTSLSYHTRLPPPTLIQEFLLGLMWLHPLGFHPAVTLLQSHRKSFQRFPTVPQHSVDRIWARQPGLLHSWSHRIQAWPVGLSLLGCPLWGWVTWETLFRGPKVFPIPVLGPHDLLFIFLCIW